MLLSGTTICDLFECLSNKSQIDDSENKISSIFSKPLYCDMPTVLK